LKQNCRLIYKPEIKIKEKYVKDTEVRLTDVRLVQREKHIQIYLSLFMFGLKTKSRSQIVSMYNM